MTQTKATVSVHIVAWNSLTHLPGCLDALVKQSYQPTNIMIVDNASVDGTVKWLEEHYPHLHLLRNTKNLGFSRGHNQALRLTNDEFVLLLNPDILLQPDWLERAVTFLVSHPEYGSYGGKTLRFSYRPGELKEIEFSDIIDSAGLQGYRNRHFIDRGSGTRDQARYQNPEEVFGHSGACVVFRRSALDDIRWQDEYLDEDFFAYKEDIDLAWRLQVRGWASRYDPDALAYHHRHIKGISSISDSLLAKNHRGRQHFLNYYSFRNQLLLLMKHETWSTWWRDGLWIAVYELKKSLYYLVTQPRTLRAISHALRLSPRVRRKGKMLRHQSKRSPLAVRKWFVH